MQGEGAAAPSPLHPYLYQGNSHAAFGGRSWRRQPMTLNEFDALTQSKQNGP